MVLRSPSTRAYDLSIKASFYRIPSIETILFIDLEQHYVQWQRRSTLNWSLDEFRELGQTVWQDEPLTSPSRACTTGSQHRLLSLKTVSKLLLLLLKQRLLPSPSKNQGVKVSFVEEPSLPKPNSIPLFFFPPRGPRRRAVYIVSFTKIDSRGRTSFARRKEWSISFLGLQASWATPSRSPRRGSCM